MVNVMLDLARDLLDFLWPFREIIRFLFRFFFGTTFLVPNLIIITMAMAIVVVIRRRVKSQR